MNIININNLTLGYNNIPVIQNLNVKINDGDFVCIVGNNGAGKSTLIKGILGLLKPISGSIELNNIKKNFIGYMPQETKVDSNFPASVYEIVLSGTLNKVGLKPSYSKELKKIADDNLKLLDIYSLKDKCFNELSGGQRQRVLLARSLCSTSKILILDEPSNNLDYNSKKNLYKILQYLNKEKKMTIIMVTHDLDHNNLIGNKILSLQKGNYFYGNTNDFVKKVHHE